MHACGRHVLRGACGRVRLSLRGTPCLPHAYGLPLRAVPCCAAVVEVLPQCVTPDRPPRYAPSTAGQHLLDKYKSTHAGYTGPTEAGGAKH